ncbi:unnamed protein product [Darwinula stevensoni]|uniref:BTB domain-containing protein n=1 Tax=Darwinula stevensoni TaxID=69355 RepID=A0A7R8XCX8_9CRUS|nr:unnamed protein product [Darwinula stevensoni]CAG0892696.1 unnamed protein product [Darwinula stevensoni]
MDYFGVDNSHRLVQKIASLYANQLLSDITLIVESKHYSAHRLILCASSDVFQVMLMDPRWTESHQSSIILEEDPACAAVFPEFLYYLYSGQVVLQQNSALPLLALADKYNVRDLREVCLTYMTNHIVAAASHGQLVSWIQYASWSAHPSFSEVCRNFIKWNFLLISEADDFGSMDKDMLESFLKDDELIIRNELTLYHCVVRWLHLQRGGREESLKDLDVGLIKKVMMCIRFPMISPRQLAEMLLYPLVSQFKEFFVERLAVGMAFHSGQHDRVEEVKATEENGDTLFRPRLYTEERWSTGIQIDGLGSLPYYYTRTLVFSSQGSLCDCDEESQIQHEWTVDVHPKGVLFQRFHLIVWQGTLEVPEHIIRTIRLSITGKNIHRAKVKVGLLLTGSLGGREHVCKVLTRRFTFSDEERVLHFNDILPFGELSSLSSPFLVGSHQDSFALRIVITPISDS